MMEYLVYLYSIPLKNKTIIIFFFKKRGLQQAEYFLDTILAGLPIVPVANNFESVIDAARIKAEYPLSFSDCLAASTARRENAIIMTDDPEFKNVEHIVKIEWLGQEQT